MKKLTVFIFIIVLLCLSNLKQLKCFSLSDIFPSATVEIYMQDCPDGITDFVTNGDGVIINADVHTMKEIIKDNEFFGLTLKIENIEVKDVLNKIYASVVFENFESVYGVCNFFDKCILVNNLRTNFQCKDLGDVVVLGFPILLGSY